MQGRIRFQKNVPADLDGILREYEQISPRTANRVRDELERSFDLISTFPEMYAKIDGEIRLVKTKRYPLLIQYCIENGTPIVLSIYHSDLDTIKRSTGDAE